MAIVINGSGTVTGLAVGGLPDGTVDAGTLATDSVTAAKLEISAITSADLPASSIVQVKSVRGNFTGDVASTSTTYAELHTSLRNTFTPKFSNSTIICEYIACSVGHSATFITFRIYADGSNIDSVNATDMWRTNSTANGESTVNVYVEVPSWGTSAKVISPYFASYASGTEVKGNYGGNNPYCFMKVTEVSA